MGSDRAMYALGWLWYLVRRVNVRSYGLGLGLRLRLGFRVRVRHSYVLTWVVAVPFCA